MCLIVINFSLNNTIIIDYQTAERFYIYIYNII
jgi:hypothetical protein